MITTASILLPILVSTGYAPANQVPPATTAKSTLEDIEVLRRLMVQEISDHDANNQPLVYSGGQGLNYTFRSLGDVSVGGVGKSVAQSRAFHLPGQGVFFSLEVQLPVIEAEAITDDEPVVEKNEAEEEWDRARTQVRTGVSSRRSLFKSEFFGVTEKDDRTWKIDPAAIVDVEQGILRILARHAGRVEGLGNSDLVTVALHMSGSESSWIVQTNDDDEECTSIGWLGGALAARRAPTKKLIVQVSMAELRRGDLNGGSKLRERARIHSY